MKVSEFLDVWGDVPRGRSFETQTHNELMVKPWVRAHGGRRLEGVTRSHAASFVLGFPSHARYAKTFMEDARGEGFVDGNPFAGLRLPTSRGRQDLDPLTEAEVWELVDAAGDLYQGIFRARMQALIAVSAFSGIRAMGAAGLRGVDIVRERPWKLRVVEKGEKGREVALVPARACALLADALVYAESGCVFLSEKRRPLDRWSIRRAFAPVKDRVGLPHITWHHLRHFCASWMIDRGAQPIDVALQLHGTTRPDVVLRYYVHASRESSFDRLAEVCA